MSAGFVLRAVAGGVATGIALSNWFLIVASFGSLLVVTGKRSGEKQLLADQHATTARSAPTLGLYTPSFLRSVRTLSAAVTVTAYCLWAFERAGQVHPGHDPIWFQLTIVPFTIALLHVMRILDSGRGRARGAGPARPPPADLRRVLGRPVRHRHLRHMSGPDAAGTRPGTVLTGWGRTAPTAAEVVHAVHPDVVDRAMAEAVSPGAAGGRGIIARGLGRSYGDAAQNAGRRGARRHLAGRLSTRSTWTRASSPWGPGSASRSLMERLVPLGWFVPVSPGHPAGDRRRRHRRRHPRQEPPRRRQLLLPRGRD